MWSRWLIHQNFVNDFRKFLELSGAVDIREALIVEADGTLYIFPDLFELALQDLGFGNVNETINHCSLEVLIVDDYILRFIELISHVRH